MRALLVGLIAVAFGLSTAAVGAAPALPGMLGLRLLDVPVAEADDPRAQLYIIDHLAPGATIQRRIEVSNSTSGTLRVDLYAAAATVERGSFSAAEGRTANGLSSWTSVSPGTPEVATGATAQARVTISVPLDAAPGEQYGVVWAEVRSATSTGVAQVSRVGIRLYVSVGAGGAPAADFTVDSLSAGRSADGAPMVVATVHNTGGRALDMSGSLQLTDGPAGLRAGPFPSILGVTLAIGDTEQVVTTLDPRLPSGPWLVAITLRSGLVERTGTATLTFPDVGTAPPVNADTGDDGGLGWGAFWIVLAVLVALGCGLFVLVRRRR